MPAPSDFNRHRREGLRADLLLILNVARPTGASEQLIMRTLGDSYDEVGPNELRKELDYLDDKGLVDISQRHKDVWKAQLSSDGIDVVEGAVTTPDGISDLR
jgi:DNA-binding PadR family transcriptional regulator